MQFVYPSFLWALSAVALPLIIHLFQFRRYKKIVFSDIRFLKQLIEQNQKQRRLREWLILCCRMVCIACLVLAFARPYVPQANVKQLKGGRVVSIFVDNSFSMSQQGKEGELFEVARNKAREIAGFYGEADMFHLLSNDFEGRHQRLVSKKDFLVWLDELKISSASRSISEILSRQKQAMENLAEANKLCYIISDFQSNRYANTSVEDSTLSVHIIPVQGSLAANLSIDTAWFESPVLRSDTLLKLRVTLGNYSASPAENAALTLQLNGKPRALQNINCEPFEKAEVTLSFTLNDTNWQAGELSILDNPVTFDDKLYIAFKPSAFEPVLIINGSEPSTYLGKIFSKEPYYRVTQIPQSQLDFSLLQQHTLVILNEPMALSSGLAFELQKHVNNGGSLFIIPPKEMTALTALNDFCRSLQVATFGTVQTGPLQVNEINERDELFRNAYSRIPGQPNWPGVSKYYPLVLSAAQRGIGLFKLNNGDNLAFKSRVGKGLLLQLAVPLDKGWSSFQQHSLFVPFMLNMPLQNKKSRALYANTRSNDWIPLELPLSEKIVYLSSPGTGRAIDLGQRNGKPMLPVNEIGQAGVYDVSRLDKSQQLAKIALNYPRAESDTRLLDPGALQEMAQRTGADINQADLTGLQQQINTEEFGIQIWRWFVLVAIVFLLAEMLLLRIRS